MPSLFKQLGFSFTLALSLVFAANGYSDEIVIEKSATKVGDFDCSNCPSRTSPKLNLANGEVTAGKLWQEFNRQGVNSVDRLTFYVALEQMDETAAYELAPLEFKIEELTANLAGNSLIVPADDSTSVPVAKLELVLPYDFMEKYSADSDVPIQFTSSDGNVSATPEVAIEYNSGFKKSHLALIAFAGFWIVVFLLFNRVTRPADNKLETSKPIPAAPQKRQALSA